MAKKGFPTKKELKSQVRYSFYSLLTTISPTLNVRVSFKRRMHRPINLQNPQTLNEIICKKKLTEFGCNPTIIQCSDKYRVRDYIKACGCEEILIPLLQHFDSETEINWDKLPQQFAMKWNYGCSFNIICPDKSKLDQAETLKKMKRWHKTKYHLRWAEMQYNIQNKKVLIEQYLKPKEGTLPPDFKLYCFHGRPLYCMICTGREKGRPVFLFYDRQFNLLKDLNKAGKNLPADFSFEKPEGYEKLFSYAEKLSAPFDFVRVDLYLCDGKVYFGELTFSPSAGLDQHRLYETDLLFGQLVLHPNPKA